MSIAVCINVYCNIVCIYIYNICKIEVTVASHYIVPVLVGSTPATGMAGDIGTHGLIQGSVSR